VGEDELFTYWDGNLDVSGLAKSILELPDLEDLFLILSISEFSLECWSDILLYVNNLSQTGILYTVWKSYPPLPQYTIS
jgi:hypothetical protein